MTLLTPIWLILLLPWAAACLWAGRGQGAAAGVPFLTLWSTTVTRRNPKRLPPLWIVLVLAGALAMIFAASGPAVFRPTPVLTLVIDRRASMTPDRLRLALDRLGLPTATRVRVVPVPGEPYETVGRPAADSFKPIALPTDAIVRQVLRNETGTVVLLTDHVTDVPPGVSVVVPSRSLANAGIGRFAVVSRRTSTPTGGPTAQAMIRVFNGTDHRRARLLTEGVTTSIELPSSGQTRDYFVDVLTVGDTAEATLLAEDGSPWADDVAGDDRAYLAQTTTGVRIDPQTPLSDPLARMVAIYQARRPAGTGAAGVAVVRDSDPAGPAVLLPEPLGPTAGGTLQVDSDHPVTRTADFRGIDVAGRSVAGPLGDAWRTLVRQGDAPLLAVRERPTRQVWVGVDTDVLAGRADYVVFWTDVFDWIAGGRREWIARRPETGLTALRVADAGLEGSPGLYQDAAGRTVATAMPAVRSGGATDGGAAVAELRRVAVPLAHWPLVAGLACLAVGLWIGRLTRY
ncbi:MAG TPA: hypothetical protein VF595_07035 [Tepidisphaeraceae bacterium]|jgi:hypothetical protein